MTGPHPPHDRTVTATGQRLDKWLWYARLAKTRSIAARLVDSGKVRVNRVRVVKPSRLVHVEDVLTVMIGGRLRILRVRGPGARRGPAAEARQLYEDLTPPPAPDTMPEAAPAQRAPGAGRPTKRDRRRIAAWAAGHPDGGNADREEED